MFFSQRRGARWYPDEVFFKEFSTPVLYLPGSVRKWTLPYDLKIPPAEKSIKNISINFGPQHPAAHGVLRLVLELEGEVYSFLNLFHPY